MTSFLVSTQAQLNSAIGNAKGGDQIVLSTSFKAQTIAIDGFNKAGGLTISSQDPMAQASVAILKITNSSGITVRNLDVAQRPDTWQTGSVINCHDVVLDNVHIHGGDDLTKAGVGLTIRYSSGVTVKNCQFDHLETGVYYFNNDHVTFDGNRVSQIVNDGFIGSETSYLTIKDNYFTDFRHFGSKHPDCIQLYTKAGDTPAHDILITGNVYNRGAGTAVQGIWIKNDTGLAPFEKVTVTNNTIVGSSWQGIGLTSVHSVELSGNVVRGYDDFRPKIWVTDTRGAVTVHDNVSTWFNYSGDNATFSNNAAVDTIPLSSIQTFTSAIDGLAAGNLAGASSAIQAYLSTTATQIAVADWHGPATSFSLPLVASAADLLARPDMVHWMGGQVAGSNVMSVASVAALGSIGQLSLANGASLTVQDTVANLFTRSGYAATHYALTTGIQIAGVNTINTSQAGTIAGWNHVSVAADASVTVVDWKGNVINSFDTLENLVSHGIIRSISLNDKAPVFQINDSQYGAYTDVFAAITGPVKEIVAVAAGHSTTAHDANATLDGSAGNAVLRASGSGNILRGGNGDMLFGGQGKDTFILHGHFGHDTINGFDAGDIVQLDKATVADFAHLQPRIHQVGSDVVIDLGAGDTLTLAGSNLAQLNSSNFSFF